MSKKYVYLFSEGNANMRELLGGKGANLAEMTNIGLPVPQGFTITTEACTQYYEDGRQINDEIMAEIMQYVAKMEEMNGKKFGDLQNPMLVSVRSGARASMPGMMDTILNLGLNDDVVAAMIKGNPDPKFERFVYDSYRRFIQMFSDVVMEVGKKYFEQLIDEMKEARGVTLDTELTADDLKELAEKVSVQVDKFIDELSRKEIMRKSIDNYGYILLADNMSDAIDAVNDIASEHLEIVTANPFDVMTRVKNAGAIFIGEYSSEPLGDYFAGPNHVLPTNGTAKFFSPLSVDDFIKKSSIIYYSREALEAVHTDIEAFAKAEQLTAHANSIAVRFEK